MRISDWSSDVCSSDLRSLDKAGKLNRVHAPKKLFEEYPHLKSPQMLTEANMWAVSKPDLGVWRAVRFEDERFLEDVLVRSEEHTSELQSLMRISYAVFCLKKKKTLTNI